jgi:hypothetical protein
MVASLNRQQQENSYPKACCRQYSSSFELLTRIEVDTTASSCKRGVIFGIENSMGRCDGDGQAGGNKRVMELVLRNNYVIRGGYLSRTRWGRKPHYQEEYRNEYWWTE